MKTAIVQASISSRRGGLYIAADATRYNVEQLRDHVRALDDGAGKSTCLSLNLSAGGDPVVVAEIETLAEELRREGIRVRFSADIDASETRSAIAHRGPPSPRIPPRTMRSLRRSRACLDVESGDDLSFAGGVLPIREEGEG